MTRGQIQISVVTDRIEVIQQELAGIAALPLTSKNDFLAKRMYFAAGESFLRRGLEALFDLGRHILSKGFGIAATEYKSVPRALLQQGIIDAETAERMIQMAGYRNRLVHFYNEVNPEELFQILTEHVGDLDSALKAIRAWLASQPDQLDADL